MIYGVLYTFLRCYSSGKGQLHVVQRYKERETWWNLPDSTCTCVITSLIVAHNTKTITSFYIFLFNQSKQNKENANPSKQIKTLQWQMHFFLTHVFLLMWPTQMSSSWGQQCSADHMWLCAGQINCKTYDCLIYHSKQTKTKSKTGRPIESQ